MGGVVWDLDHNFIVVSVVYHPSYTTETTFYHGLHSAPTHQRTNVTNVTSAPKVMNMFFMPRSPTTRSPHKITKPPFISHHFANGDARAKKHANAVRLLVYVICLP